MESEFERSLRGGLMEFSPKESFSAMMSDQQGDSSSAEDAESPKSPAYRSAGTRRRRRLSKVAEDRKERSYMHSQVLRIKEEESQIGAEFIGDYYYDLYEADSQPFDDRLVIWSRTILPASPLSGKKIGRND